MEKTLKPYDSNLQALLLLAPTIAVLVAFLYYPGLQTFRLSLYETLFLGQQTAFTGLDNYATILTDNTYRNSILVSFAFAGVVVVGTMFVGLAIAYMLSQVEVGASVYLVSAIWPYALPTAVAAAVLSFIFHPSLGIFTHYFEALTPWTVDWFASGRQAFAVVAIAAIWKQVGYNVIFMVASLNNVPDSLTENARLDGVGHLRLLRKVYVPLMAPTLVFLLAMNTIYAFFGTFPLIDIMTSGGPSEATNLLIFQLYRDAFEFSNLGLASAQSVVLFAIVSIAMYLQLRVSEQRAYYGG